MRVTLIALALLIPLATAGCVDKITGTEAADSYTPPPNPTFTVRVVDGAGVGISGAQVCIGDTETDATTSSGACRGTRPDGTVRMTWPCEGECPNAKYVGAVWRDPETGRLRSSVETEKTATPPTKEIVLYIIR